MEGYLIDIFPNLMAFIKRETIKKLAKVQAQKTQSNDPFGVKKARGFVAFAPVIVAAILIGVAFLRKK